MNLLRTVLTVVDKDTKISVKIRISADIQKVKYRPIISVDRYIDRSLAHTHIVAYALIVYKNAF